MKKHVLQWHIIHNCNLRCKHCYQDDYKSQMSFDDMKKIFNQYVFFCKKNNYRGHINFTGGEPFLSPYLYEMLDLCEKNGITFGVLTNGTLINSDVVARLAAYNKLSFVQISVDGVKKTHDEIRGEGNFDKAFDALKMLKKSGIQTMVAFTCHKENYQELQKVIRLVRRKKIDRFWVDRLIPMGSNKEMILSTDEYKKVIKILTKESKKTRRTVVHLNRALQFLEGGEAYYRCSAGISLLTILADGTLLPCRRFPIEIGNVLGKNIDDLCANSEVINDLKTNRIPKACTKCVRANKCEGGAKCLTYALTGDYHGKDVNCYY